MKAKGITLIHGNASSKLAQGISRYLNIPIVDTLVSRFKDGEIRVQIKENIRGSDVFIIQSTNPPADNLLELLLLADAAKRASAKRITAVIPYFGYARQDRKDQPRVPISAKVMADLLQVVGINRVLTLDLHADQIQGFFDIPVDNLFVTPVMKEYFIDLDPSVWTVVAPDVGATKRARAIARKLGNLPLALIDKRRPEPNVAEVLHVIGNVQGRKLLILDDIIDTGNTIQVAADKLKALGALEIKVAAAHALFSDNAVEKLCNAPIDEIVITDSIEHKQTLNMKKLKILSVAPLLAKAIRRIHDEESVSELFI